MIPITPTGWTLCGLSRFTKSARNQSNRNGGPFLDTRRRDAGVTPTAICITLAVWTRRSISRAALVTVRRAMVPNEAQSYFTVFETTGDSSLCLRFLLYAVTAKYHVPGERFLT